MHIALHKAPFFVLLINFTKTNIVYTSHSHFQNPHKKGQCTTMPIIIKHNNHLKDKKTSVPLTKHNTENCVLRDVLYLKYYFASQQNDPVPDFRGHLHLLFSNLWVEWPIKPI